MYKKLVTVLALFLVSITASAARYDDEVADMEVVPDYVCNEYTESCSAIWRYTIFSLVDGLSVKNVIVNKGKCAAKTQYFNRNLREDDYAEFTVTTDDNYRRCRPNVVDVYTNKGTYTFDFN